MVRSRSLIVVLGLMGCATVTADSTQSIHVETKPAGASCSLTNNVGSWEMAKTPGDVLVDRSFSPLTITCRKVKAGSGTAILEPQTRNRAYGNLLLLGVPAVVDAGTGAGYEYAVDHAEIVLKK